MKKYLYLSICILLCFISACSSYNDNVNRSLSEFESHQSENKEIIDSGKYYRIYKENTTQVSYDIYNSNGEVILSETTDRPLMVNMLNADIIDIGIDMGTGLTKHRYYSVKQNLFSQDFLYVLSNANELVAYIDVPKENPFEDRKIVVQNAFNKDLFYKDFKLDFSHVDTPVIKATFSKDETSLQLIYLSGEDQTQISKTLKLD